MQLSTNPSVLDITSLPPRGEILSAASCTAGEIERWRIYASASSVTIGSRHAILFRCFSSRGTRLCDSELLDTHRAHLDDWTFQLSSAATDNTRSLSVDNCHVHSIQESLLSLPLCHCIYPRVRTYMSPSGQSPKSTPTESTNLSAGRHPLSRRVRWLSPTEFLV